MMNPVVKYTLILYQLFIALPILIVLTITTALLTMLFAIIAKNTELLYIPARYWSRLACYLFFVHVKVRNKELINKSQSVIYVSNHQSMFDIWAIYGWLPVRFNWIIKKELRKIPLVGMACEKAGHIFINRSNPAAAKKSMQIAKKKLTDGNCLVIFPEGTRSKDGSLGPFKKGAFTLAIELNLPLAPITIKGAYQRLNRKNKWVRPGVIELIFHEKLQLAETEIKINELKETAFATIQKGLSD